jgi:hypothetical protein
MDAYLGKNEAGTNPDGAGTECQGSRQTLTVVETTGSDDLDGLASQRALVALDELSDGRDEDGGGDITSVSTALATLCADHVDTELEALLDVLGVTDHVHVEDAGTVETLDNVLGWDTDGGDEEPGAGVDDDVDQLIELTLGVVVAMRRITLDSHSQLPFLSKCR